MIEFKRRAQLVRHVGEKVRLGAVRLRDRADTLVIRLEDEVIGPALQSADHVLGIGHRGDEDDRDVAKVGVRLDAAGKFVAVHFRHDHVADDECRLELWRHFQRQAAVGGNADFVPLLFENVLQPLGLGGAVFRDQDFHG